MTPLSILSVTIFCVSVTLITPLNFPDEFAKVTKGIETFFSTGVPDFLPNALKNFQLTHVFRPGMEKVFSNPQLCVLCKLVADLIIAKRRLGVPREVLAKEAEFLCVGLGIENGRVCRGAIGLNLDIFLHIIDHYPVRSDRICGLLLQSYGCPNQGVFNWSVELPSGESVARVKSHKGGSFRILQLSDVHYDPNYTPYGNADCGEPLCCQGDQGEGSSVEKKCGFWSDYRDADVPWHLLEETARQVKTQDFDYVYFTGDIISHRIWETSVSNNTKAIAKFFSFLKNTFKVPVYPIFGNHEPHPLNVWTSERVDDSLFPTRWLFEQAAEAWSELVGQDIKETVLKGGYYTVSPKPGFRIVAINSNLCYTFNWWLIVDDFDPYGQLKWLAETLKKAEDDNESVHILTHVPTGAECLNVWSREYSRIVERFSNTITGQFCGHTHLDEFQVYYHSSESTKPVGVVFNGASLTPFSSSNPSYKIYQVDSATFSLRDYEEWTFNLTQANLQPGQPPEWYKLYSFVEAYGVDNLEAEEVDKVVYKMAKDHSLLDKYFQFKYRNGDPGVGAGCDDACKRENLCQVATTVYTDDKHCNRFLKMYQQ